METLLTPQQQLFEQQIEASPTIKDIKECLSVFEDEQRKLMAGQAEIKRDVQEGFAKGKNRMDGMDEMFKDHINTTQHNHKEAMDAISGLNIEIKDNKLKELKDELTGKRDKEDKEEESKKRFYDYIKIFLFTSALGAIWFLFDKAYLSHIQ